ncbi:DUF6262 family protein [Citricoccus sp. NPDC079358]|jgi:hypothetical protein|uniref:Tn554-related transposase C n=1 Tax=Paenarthrobacter aurescens (strain TC1) TaxID=290340 RepID=A1R4J0_PAEAT|nr:DUF6262 family protein [Paenarthrobacter aurescens]ABM06478.1 Tn554-related transposase C [Paenarthrobacter aurescens TC1]
MPAENSKHLTAAARRRHELARSKAIRTLRELDRAGDPVTFEAVARHAGVSRAFLYAQPDLRADIERLRDATGRAPAPAIPASQRASDASLLARLHAANERVRTLTEENDKLRRRLAHALGDQRTTRRGQGTQPTPRKSRFNNNQTPTDAARTPRTAASKTPSTTHNPTSEA